MYALEKSFHPPVTLQIKNPEQPFCHWTAGCKHRSMLSGAGHQCRRKPQ